MKKIVSITMMMVAIMVATFSFVSCGSDDDNKIQYRLETSLKITEPGNLTEEQCEQLIAHAKQNIVADHNSDAEAEMATGEAAEAMAHGLEATADELGDAVLTYTFKCTKVSTGAQVITYYVDFDEGDINVYNNKN